MPAIQRVVLSPSNKKAISKSIATAEAMAVQCSARNKAELAEGLKSVGLEYFAANFDPKLVVKKAVK